MANDKISLNALIEEAEAAKTEPERLFAAAERC